VTHGAAVLTSTVAARATKEEERPEVGQKTRRFWWKCKKIEAGRKQGRIDWAAEKSFQFFKQRFEFKSQGFKYF
jgi:hypothetical protein